MNRKRNSSDLKALYRTLKDFFTPKRLAMQTVGGKNLIPQGTSVLPRVLAVVAILFMLLSTLLSES